MKTLILSVIISVSFCGQIYSQTDSIDQLGLILTESLISNDTVKFMTLIMSKDLFIKVMKENVRDDVNKDILDSLIMELDANYSSLILANYIKYFKILQKKVVLFNIKFDNLKYKIVASPGPAMGDNIKIIHADLSHTTFKHLYFSVFEYKGDWFLSSPYIQITEK